MEEFEVGFCNKQEEYMYQEGMHRGFTIISSKVIKCLFLSSQAKQLYTNLRDYVWDGKKECHPSQASLRTELRWSKQTLVTYLTELEEKHFIVVAKGGIGTPTRYLFRDLDQIPMLRHSEMLYTFKPKTTEGIDLFYKALGEYEKTDLCELANGSCEPERYIAQVRDWFLVFFKAKVVTEHSEHDAEPDPTPDVEPDDEPKQDVPSSLPDKDRRLAGIAPSPGIDVHKVADPDKEKKPKKVINLDDPVDKWDNRYFLSYFEEKYQERYKTSYFPERWDLKALRVAIEKRGDNALFKKMLDIYFGHDEVFSKHYVSGFCGTYVQNSISAFLSTGQFYTRFDGDKKSSDTPAEEGQIGSNLMDFLRENDL